MTMSHVGDKGPVTADPWQYILVIDTSKGWEGSKDKGTTKCV
jgi:hypothetical protein